MKKTQFKVTLFEGANKTAELIALEAARYNGRSDMDINLLYAFGMTIKALSKDENTNMELAGENTLCVDVRINGNWKQGAVIEQVEVFALNSQFTEQE